MVEGVGLVEPLTGAEAALCEDVLGRSALSLVACMRAAGLGAMVETLAGQPLWLWQCALEGQPLAAESWRRKRDRTAALRRAELDSARAAGPEAEAACDVTEGEDGQVDVSDVALDLDEAAVCAKIEEYAGAVIAGAVGDPPRHAADLKRGVMDALAAEQSAAGRWEDGLMFARWILARRAGCVESYAQWRETADYHRSVRQGEDIVEVWVRQINRLAETVPPAEHAGGGDEGMGPPPGIAAAGEVYDYTDIAAGGDSGAGGAGGGDGGPLGSSASGGGIATGGI